MVSWALCSAHSSIMDGKSDTVTAVALRGSERERGKVRDGEIERESMQGVILSSSSGKIGDSLQHKCDIHTKTHHAQIRTHTHMHAYAHTHKPSPSSC